jgi:uncharacterized protein (TIGR03437 family)
MSWIRRVIVLTLLLTSMGLIGNGQTLDDFFDDSYVHEIRIVLRASDWDTLRARYLLNDYYPADVHWIFKGRDITIPDCGIRSRGHGSRSSEKPNLRVDLNRFQPGQTFLTLKSFVLNANNQDASMMSEKAAFKLWGRTGLPVSREAFARVYINNVYWGLYLLEEEVQEDYVTRKLGDSGGDLYDWKPIDVTPDGVYRGYRWEWTPTCKDSTSIACSTDPKRWAPEPWNPEENKTTFDLAPTIDLHRMSTMAPDAEFDSTISGILDLPLFMLHMGIELFIADFDSFLYSPFGVNNIYIYRYKNTRFHQFIVWDKNGAFHGGQVPLFYKTDTNTLMRRTLAVPAHKREFIEGAYKTAVLAGGAGGWLAWEFNRGYELALDAIRQDSKKQYQDMGVNKPSSNEIFEQRVSNSRSFIDARQPFVLREVAAAGLQHPTDVFISEGGAVNAAANQIGTVAPGAMVSLYGGGFSTAVQMAAGDLGWPTTLGGVTVYVNGFEAPLQFVSPGQINLQVPWEVGLGDGTIPFTVSLSGPVRRGTRDGSPANAKFTNTVMGRIGAYSPGIYAVAHADGTPVQSRPVKAGDILVVYANGLGAVSNRPRTGGVTSLTTLSETAETPIVTVGGQSAEVLFSGLAPGFIAAYQVNIRTPGVTGSSAPIVIRLGGENSQGYVIPVQ